MEIGLRSCDRHCPETADRRLPTEREENPSANVLYLVSYTIYYNSAVPNLMRKLLFCSNSKNQQKSISSICRRRPEARCRTDSSQSHACVGHQQDKGMNKVAKVCAVGGQLDVHFQEISV